MKTKLSQVISLYVRPASQEVGQKLNQVINAEMFVVSAGSVLRATTGHD